MPELKSLIASVKWDTNGRNAATVAAAAKEDLQALILHAGQDYGGQGARWAKAAGKEDLQTIYLAAGQDTAGIGSRYAALAAKYDHLSIRAAHRSQTYLDYPYDILWDRRTDALVKQLAADADVVHLNDRTYAYLELGLQRKQKPALLHHHGAAYRFGAKNLDAEARRYGMVQAVSTVDLLAVGACDIWLPAPYDLDALMDIRLANARPEDGRVRVIQSPTNRGIKSTDKLEAAVRILQDRGHPVDLVVVENTAWRDALKVKATADIFFDQVQLGYGCSAIEAWGMGLPVIAGGDAWTEARMAQEYGGPLPYLKAEDSVESILAALESLVVSPELRAYWAHRGQTHAWQFHAELPALARLVELYFRAIGTRREPSDVIPDYAGWPQGPGIFHSEKYRALTFYEGGDRFTFQGGRLEEDAYRAPKVRAFVAKSPQYGIVELPAGTMLLTREGF